MGAFWRYIQTLMISRVVIGRPPRLYTSKYGRLIAAPTTHERNFTADESPLYLPPTPKLPMSDRVMEEASISALLSAD